MINFAKYENSQEFIELAKLINELEKNNLSNEENQDIFGELQTKINAFLDLTNDIYDFKEQQLQGAQLFHILISIIKYLTSRIQNSFDQEIEEPETKDNLSEEIDGRYPTLLLLEQKVLSLNEENVEFVIQSIIDLFDKSFPDTFNLIISQIIYKGFVSRKLEANICFKFIQILETKETFKKPKSYSNIFSIFN